MRAWTHKRRVHLGAVSKCDVPSQLRVRIAAMETVAIGLDAFCSVSVC